MRHNEIECFLPRSLVKQLSQINSRKSSCSIFFDWFLIISIIVVCQSFFHWYFYLLAIIFISALQFSLSAFMHDGVHGRLFSKKKINDYVGIFVLAAPLFISFQSYRATHLKHHAYLNSKNDPDLLPLRDNPELAKKWHFPLSSKQLLSRFFKDMIGITSGIFYFKLITNFCKKLRFSKLKQNINQLSFKKNEFQYFIFYSGVALLLTMFHGWILFFMYWFIPLNTWYIFTSRLRLIAEHFPLQYDNDHKKSRTIYLNLLERVFLTPSYASYHLDHHLFPAVPVYNLKLLHAYLLQTKHYSENARITYGYWELFKECTRTDQRQL